jgi:hypothetical protein
LFSVCFWNSVTPLPLPRLVLNLLLSASTFQVAGIIDRYHHACLSVYSLIFSASSLSPNYIHSSYNWLLCKNNSMPGASGSCL